MESNGHPGLLCILESDPIVNGNTFSYLVDEYNLPLNQHRVQQDKPTQRLARSGLTSSTYVVSLLCAVLAAFLNAVSTITQHVASTRDYQGLEGMAFRPHAGRKPLWLLGWAALLGAFVFQAVALHNGLLSLVQTVLMTELVFSLVLRRVWIRQRIAPAAWASAALTCIAVSVFIAVAEPRGFSSTCPNSPAWASSILACGGCATVLALLATRGLPAPPCGLVRHRSREQCGRSKRRSSRR